MKPQTPEEILKEAYQGDESFVGVFSPYDFEKIHGAIQEGMRQAIKYALEDAASNGMVQEITDYSLERREVIGHKVDKSSILSRYESIIKELGL